MRRGLTTVEVLVASAVVLVFLAVGVPAARALLGRSRVSACAERLHTLGAALAMYANDHDGALPAATTVETPYRDRKGVPEAELLASPETLRTLLGTYAIRGEAWFCPLDPHKGESVLWLDQRHAVTSFRYAPTPSAEEPVWPPRLALGKESGPLLGDAFGLNAGRPASNHPEGTVNLLAHDLSLSRGRAKDLLAGR